jgi:hypothetical protein
MEASKQAEAVRFLCYNLHKLLAAYSPARDARKDGGSE